MKSTEKYQKSQEIKVNHGHHGLQDEDFAHKNLKYTDDSNYEISGEYYIVAEECAKDILQQITDTFEQEQISFNNNSEIINSFESIRGKFQCVIILTQVATQLKKLIFMNSDGEN